MAAEMPEIPGLCCRCTRALPTMLKPTMLAAALLAASLSSAAAAKIPDFASKPHIVMVREPRAVGLDGAAAAASPRALVPPLAWRC